MNFNYLAVLYDKWKRRKNQQIIENDFQSH